MMLLEGQQCSHYRLLRLLKQGGMGKVYLAQDTNLRRQVAIKVIHIDAAHAADQATALEAARLFKHEAHAIAQLDHIHILPLYDYGEEYIDNTKVMYMVMPLREEGSFADWLSKYARGRSLPLAAVESVVRQAAQALQHAHDKDIIHKDIKPSNILVRGHAEQPDQLNLQLADFGVAKVMTMTSESGIIRGTPTYMAPEQWENRPVFATDQYALAIMAYELLVGRPPFEGRDNLQLLYKHSQVRPARPSAINSNVSDEIDEVLLRALAKNPKNRFPSVSTFAQAFRYAVLSSANVEHNITLSAYDAARGTNCVVTLPDGRQVPVSIPPGAYQGQIVQLENHGNPTTYDGPRGTLILTISVLPPVEEVTYAASYLAPTVPVILPSEWDRPSNPARHLKPKRSQSRPLRFTIAICVLLILGTSSCYAVFNRMEANAISNTHEVATLTATAATATIVGATADVATAQAQATATTIQANPYPTYFTGSGQLALYDTLKDDNRGYQWLPTEKPTLPANNGNCVFSGGGLTAMVAGDQMYDVLFHPCISYKTNFSDFAYEVHATLLVGDCAGVTFRGKGSAFYYFVVCQDGHYRFVRYTRDPGPNVTPDPTLNQMLKDANSSYIKLGLNQDNLIAIRAQGAGIGLYVNQQLIDTVVDTAYSGGQIGVIAKSWGINDPTEAVFSNARVWNLA